MTRLGPAQCENKRKCDQTGQIPFTARSNIVAIARKNNSKAKPYLPSTASGASVEAVARPKKRLVDDEKSDDICLVALLEAFELFDRSF